MSHRDRPAGVGGGPSLVDTHEVDDGWGDGEEDEPAASSTSEGEAPAVQVEPDAATAELPYQPAPSATPGIPTAPTASEGHAVAEPREAQLTIPMIDADITTAIPSGAGTGDIQAPIQTTVAAVPPGVPAPAELNKGPRDPSPMAPWQPQSSTEPLRIGPLRGAAAAVLLVLFGTGWLVAAALILRPVVAPALMGSVEATGVTAAASVCVQAVAEHRHGQRERATGGTPEALAKLAALPPEQRTAAEALALARGRRAERIGQLVALEQEIQANPELAKDRKILSKIHRSAYDPPLAQEALRIMAGLPGQAGPDLLYAVWTHTTRRTPTTTLARNLLLTKEVVERAAPALTVVLGLRVAEDCEARRKLLADAQDHGDARALRQLNLLKLKTGCGPKKMKDCHPCLRAGSALDDAIKAVVARQPPRY